MATKNTLFEVDIKKENPLLTIIKHGKVPVIRFSNKGFQNYKQKSYYDAKEDILEKDKMEKGCFVHIGRVQGSEISSWHFKEDLHIGYVEPDELVFSTYSYGHQTHRKFSLITAKERLDDALLSYKYFMKKGKKEHYGLGNLDFYVEAIVDSRHIKKVLTLHPKDFVLLVPYLNDDFYKVYTVQDIFYAMFEHISCDFWQHIDFPNAIQEDKLQYTDENYKYGDLKYFSDFYDKYGDKLIQEFEYYYKNHCYLRPHSYYVGIKNAYLNLSSLMKNGREYLTENVANFFENQHKSNVASGFNVSLTDEGEVCIKLEFPYFYNSEKIDNIFINMTTGYLHIAKRNPKWYFDNDESYYLYNDLNEMQLFSNQYRYYLYNVISVWEYFYENFKDFYSLKEPSWYGKLKQFYDVELYLKQYDYEFKDNYSEFCIKTEKFILEYNIILQDAIVTIPNSEKLYYNIEVTPTDFDKTELYKLLKVLRNLGP